MCGINPKHQCSVMMDVFTSQNVTKEEFEDNVFQRILDMEIELNKKGDLRFHVIGIGTFTKIEEEKKNDSPN